MDTFDTVGDYPYGIQRHPHGLVGNLWRIKDPKTIMVGNCFLEGRLKKNDLFLCTHHDGDCFQYYMYVEEYANCLIGKPEWNFGSYGIGNSKKIKISKPDFEILKEGGRIEITKPNLIQPNKERIKNVKLCFCKL